MFATKNKKGLATDSLGLAKTEYYTAEQRLFIVEQYLKNNESWRHLANFVQYVVSLMGSLIVIVATSEFQITRM